MKSRFLLIFTVLLYIFTSCIFCFPNKTFAEESWTSGSAGGTGRMFNSGTFYMDNIYYWGGVDDNGNEINTMDIYNIRSNSWSTKKAGGTARQDHTATLYNGKIFFWGGYYWVVGEGSHWLNTIDVYDIATDSWSTKKAGGTARSAHSAVLFQDNIYFWGGVNGVSLNTVDVYNITNDTWTTGESGGTARDGHQSVIYNDKMYSWGGVTYNEHGMETLNTMDIYDIKQNTWHNGSPGGTPRYNSRGVLYNDMIYYWGGIDAEFKDINTVDIYNISEDTWLTGLTGGTPRDGHSAVIYNGLIYNWGGWDAEGNILTTIDIFDTNIYPAFENLPNDTRPINIDEGQVIIMPSYNLEAKPEGGNGVTQVEFKVDGNLICTDTTADADGVYSCLWDTTTYHSDIEVIAYFVSNDPITLTRTAFVNISNNSPNLTELPATGMDAIKYD